MLRPTFLLPAFRNTPTTDSRKTGPCHPCGRSAPGSAQSRGAQDSLGILSLSPQGSEGTGLPGCSAFLELLSEAGLHLPIAALIPCRSFCQSHGTVLTWERSRTAWELRASCLPVVKNQSGSLSPEGRHSSYTKRLST